VDSVPITEPDNKRQNARNAYPQFVLQTWEHDAGDVRTGNVRRKWPKGATSCAGNKKGCEVGYALAAGSCERANSVEACTVAALDVITAFAVPNPNCSSQSQSVFSGLVALQVAPPSRSLSLLRIDKFYFANPFDRRRQSS
jgi:hypothetical protein